MAQLTFYYLQKLVLGNKFSSLGSHVDFPGYISIAVKYRFIRNLEVVIRDREKSSSDQGKSLQMEGWEDHFEVKLRSETWQLHFQNIFQFENLKDLFIYRCIKYSCFTFLFHIFFITVQFYIFSNQTKIVNESITKKC